MLRTSPEVRLFGLPYRSVFIGLATAGTILLALLIVSFQQTHVDIPEWKTIPDLLTQVRAHWIRTFVIFALLAITSAAGILTAYSYFATQEKLAKVQATTKAILESLVGGVLCLDRDGRVTIINRAASQIFELSPEPPYPDLTELSRKHPELGEVIRRALDRGEYIQDRDSLYVNSKNDRVFLRTSVSEYRDETGQRLGIVVLVKDVSKVMVMEQELRRQDRLAASGTLAAGIAHEIRNPLSAVELNLRLLQEEIANALPGREDIDGYFEVLSAETRRLNRVATTFLQLSRPEPIVRAPISVHDPLLQVIRLLETEAREKRVSFAVDLVAGEPTVLGDLAKIEQVCLNILINAMQAMPNGGVIRVSSTFTETGAGRSVDLVFADEGIGISPENIPRLFDPYFTTRADGTGLGLAIAYRIITDHSGEILVASIRGKGTTVTVRLPIAAPVAVKIADNQGQ